MSKRRSRSAPRPKKRGKKSAKRYYTGGYQA